MAKAIAEVKVKTGTYEKDGQTKGRYEKVGTVFEGENGQKSMLLTMVPLCNFGRDGGVWLSIFPIDNNRSQQPQQPQGQQPPSGMNNHGGYQGGYFQQQQRQQQPQQPQQPPMQPPPNQGGGTW